MGLGHAALGELWEASTYRLGVLGVASTLLVVVVVGRHRGRSEGSVRGTILGGVMRRWREGGERWEGEKRRRKVLEKSGRESRVEKQAEPRV